MKVKVKRIGGHSLPIPKYETAGASGMDLRARVTFEEDVRGGGYGGGDGPEGAYVVVPHGERVSLRCGFAFEVPPGYELQVRPRSGLSFKGVFGTFGTVDSDYRGEVRILLTNLSGDDLTVRDGDRIAQGVIAPVSQADLEEVEELTPTERGGNGFGSTGTR